MSALGLVLKAATLLGGASMVAPPAFNAITGKTGRDMRKQILLDGPDTVEGGEPKFRTNPLQDIFVDKESLLPQYYKEKKEKVEGDTRVAAILSQLPDSAEVRDNEDASSVIRRYAKEFKESKTAEALDLDKKKREAAFKDPAAKAERDYRRDTDAENTRRFEAKEEKADRRFNATQMESINARRDQTALGMAQLDITRQQEANRMSEETRRYDQRRADSKKERMAAIIAGLANLGGAFAA